MFSLHLFQHAGAVVACVQTLLKPSGSSSNSLTLVGVGPEDPELLTIAAVRAVEQAEVVAYPVGREGGTGMALTIAERWLKPDQQRLPLLFPMVAEAGPRIDAWRCAADRLAQLVGEGRRVVLLCEGDVSLFATGSYVQLALRERYPDLPFRLVPGIPAVCAAAAAAPSQGLDLPLAFQQEGLLIRPCPESSAPLETLLQVAEENHTVLGLIKVGQRWPWVRTVLQRRNLLEQAVFAQRVGWPDQWIARAAEVSEETKPYFSLLLIRQFWPQVLP